MTPRRPWPLALSLVLVALLGPAAADPVAPLAREALAPGVVHATWAFPGSAAPVHLAELAPDAAVRLRVVPAGGGLLGGRETTTALCRRTPRCVVAVNGDFFDDDGVLGGLVAGGRVLRSPRPGHEQLSLAPLGVVDDAWRGSVEGVGLGLSLHAVNRPVPAGQVVLWTPDAGPATPACTCTEVLLRTLHGRAGTQGEPVASVVTARRSGGGTPLVPGTTVLASEGPALVPLAVDDVVSVRVATASPSTEGLGAHPVVLRDGRPAPVDPADPMLRDPEPRTVLAWDTTGRTWLGVLDGRQPGGPGPTAGGVVAFLLGIGATDAVLLDGGGSSTMATPAGALNRPSDGAERRVAAAVVVVADPPAEVRPAAAVPVAVRGTAPTPDPTPSVRSAPPAPSPAAAPPAAQVARSRPARAPEPAPAAAAPVRAPLAVLPAARVLPAVVPAGPGPVRTAALLLAAVLLAWVSTVWLGAARDVVRRSGPAPR